MHSFIFSHGISQVSSKFLDYCHLPLTELLDENALKVWRLYYCFILCNSYIVFLLCCVSKVKTNKYALYRNKIVLVTVFKRLLRNSLQQSQRSY